MLKEKRGLIPSLRITTLLSLLIVLLLVVACGGSSSDDGDAAPADDTTAEEAAPAEDDAETDAEEETADEEADDEAEAEATEPAEEEADDEAEAEATEPAEEEADEEADDEADAEATAPAEEEADEESDEEASDDDAMAMAGDPEAGEYVFTATGGCGCHFNRDLGALAGGNGFMDDAVYSKNLTPHETGILNVSDEDLADSIRFASHDDHALVVMPAFSTMADDDVANLIAYLRSQEPVENEIPERELDFEPTPGEYDAPPAVAPTEGADRGQYLMALARCGRCHTPTDDEGNMDMSMMLAGAPFRDTVAPNLTPDDETGLGQWSEEEIAEFLATGIYSNGTEAHSGMMGQVEGITSQLTEDDRMAIATFLKSLPAVENAPQASE